MPGLGSVQMPGPPAGFMPRVHKVGAPSGFLSEQPSGSHANTERLKQLIHTPQERHDPDMAEKGTLKFIGRTEEQYDLIASACGIYYRPLLPSLFG